ncbi:ADP-ribosylglycohydrolase family protein [Streptomyces sp. NPDC051940]|uniref:ADP-ribosylglycohydrolase family protein n=1 Tax=Streptomyces sp. NPDC051940 TaxID=3155675 RepID=UPI003434A332
MDLLDRVYGGWLGRIAGNMLGKPVENGDHWTRDRIDRYLRRANALPLDDYLPALHPPPDPVEFELRPEWPLCVRGQIRGSCRDDDVDYAVLGLELLERYGFGFTTAQVGELWLERLPYLQTFTAERVAYRNLVDGLAPPATATTGNPYQDWIGALIRADIHGWVCPGDPVSAAGLARRDALVSHTGAGADGAMWAAALIAAAFTASSAREALFTSLTVLPSGAVREVVARTAELHDKGVPWAQALAETAPEPGRHHWIHVVPNAAVITAGLLYGEGDFTRTIALTVRGGLDTDSNGATAGSVAGVLCGAPHIPPQWTEPLQDTVRSAVFGYDGSRISALASRTLRLARSTAPRLGSGG